MKLIAADIVLLSLNICMYHLLTSVEPKDNTILVCRLIMWLICAFLRVVCRGGKGEGYSPSVRASIQPDTTVGTARFRTQYLKHSSCSNFLLCPFCGLISTIFNKTYINSFADVAWNNRNFTWRTDILSNINIT